MVEKIKKFLSKGKIGRKGGKFMTDRSEGVEELGIGNNKDWER